MGTNNKRHKIFTIVFDKAAFIITTTEHLGYFGNNLIAQTGIMKGPVDIPVVIVKEYPLNCEFIEWVIGNFYSLKDYLFL